MTFATQGSVVDRPVSFAVSELSHGSDLDHVQHQSSFDVEENNDLHVPDIGPFWLELINPHSRVPNVMLTRFVVVSGLCVGLLAISFLGLRSPTAWSVGLGALAASLILWVFIILREKVWPNNYLVGKRTGKYPMVSWMGFSFMLELLYHMLGESYNPTYKDARETHALRSRARVYDERTNAKYGPDGRFFFDFVADTGDGFDSSYLVAYMLAQKSITVEEREPDQPPKLVELPRSQVVVHGGDICYPVMTYENLHSRFLQPFSWAFPESTSNGEAMYLAAGNHEYIDGLKGYRNFLLPETSMGGWRLPQEGSYFAIRLPRNWVIFVIDLGPEPEDIDDYQREWFDNVDLSDDERIIMLYHVPEWVKNDSLGYHAMPKLREWRKGLGDRVRAVFAGDLHYYRRMEEVSEDDPDRAYEMQPEERRDHGKGIAPSKDSEIAAYADAHEEYPTPHRGHSGLEQVNCSKSSERQYYIVGIGGAFCHATHFPRVDRLRLFSRPGRCVETRCDFPVPSESRKIWNRSWIVMFFTTTNRLYLRFIGALYMFMCIGVYPGSFDPKYSTQLDAWIIVDVVQRIFETGFVYPCLILIIAYTKVMIFANYELHTILQYAKPLTLFAFQVIGHVGTALFSRVATDITIIQVVGLPTSWLGTFLYCLVANVIMYYLGYVFGGLVLTVYYRISIEQFGWHYNEAISMIQIDDFKGFLRVGIQENGDLDIYTIVNNKTPRDWQEESSDPNVPRYVSDKVKPHLLEKVTLSYDKSP